MAPNSTKRLTSKAHIGLFTGFTPEGHYSEGLAHAVWNLGNPRLTVLAGRHESLPDNPAVKSAWRPGFSFLSDGLRAIEAHDFDLVHIQHEFTMFGSGISVPQVRRLAQHVHASGIPLVTTIHAVPAHRSIDSNFVRAFMGTNRIPAAIVRALIVWTIRGLCLHSTCVITHTQGLGQLLAREYGLATNRLIHIPLGVPVRVPPAESHDKSDSPLIVCPGYVSRRKGLETVIRAFGKVLVKIPNARLRLVGGIAHSTYERELQALAADVGAAEAVMFTGMVPLSQFYDELRRAQVVVLGAEYSISASQPLAQAWAVGAAIAAPRVGAFKELLNNGIDGRLYPAGEPAALATMLIELLQSPTDRGRLSDGSRSRASRDSWTKVSRRTVDLYNQVITRNDGEAGT